MRAALYARRFADRRLPLAVVRNRISVRDGKRRQRESRLGVDPCDAGAVRSAHILKRAINGRPGRHVARQIAWFG